MELIRKFIDLVLHLDQHLDSMVQSLGPWLYLILFVIIFCETGLVVTPFLPGDSLLFAVGVLTARTPGLNLPLVIVLLTCAAILGDNVNYWLGRFLGPKIFQEKRRFLNRKHLDKTHDFYERYGRKTIIIARFVPIVRTFAPFVAGIGQMPYPRFIGYCIAGGLLWIVGLTALGNRFAENPFVKKNFSVVVLMIIFISVLPAVFEFFKERSRMKKAPQV